MDTNAGSNIKTCDTIPLDYEKITRDEYERCKECGFPTDSWQKIEMVKSVDLAPALYECLQDIEQKLNLIIRHLSMLKEGKTVIPQEREIEISASYIIFDTEEPLTVGDILKLKMILPLYPIAYLTLFSEVTGIERSGDRRNKVSINYLDLSDDTRDKIISYLFKKQREAIRNEKR